MLTDSVGEEFKKCTRQTSCLCPVMNGPSAGKAWGWEQLDSWNHLEAFSFTCLKTLLAVNWTSHASQIYMWSSSVSLRAILGFLTVWWPGPREDECCLFLRSGPGNLSYCYSVLCSGSSPSSAVLGEELWEGCRSHHNAVLLLGDRTKCRRLRICGKWSLPCSTLQFEEAEINIYAVFL